ncbi:MAG TPA: metal ABC transporter ATP-binding protein [Anaeromyxobacteraceae bacterium]|nr:metal ABC transporter ATP-binding protein [Anaeromyxobacteraceae bacterium]
MIPAQPAAAPGQGLGAPAGAAPLVALRGAAIGYGGLALLPGIDLAVAPGDFLAIVGPNGGGKTTLLRTLLGSLPVVSGRREQARPVRIGYVPQRDQVDAIWPLTAGEVVLMGRAHAIGPLRRPGPADRAAAAAALRRVGIEELSGRFYGELSGGQRQRTLIARALAAEPELLAVDEPTNGMDPAAELSTMDVLRDLHGGNGGLAVVMVSHRLDAVANYARALAFVDKEKRLFQVGPLAEMLRPEALSALYGRAVTVREEGGRRYVHPVAGGGAP